MVTTGTLTGGLSNTGLVQAAGVLAGPVSNVPGGVIALTGTTTGITRLASPGQVQTGTLASTFGGVFGLLAGDFRSAFRDQLVGHRSSTPHIRGCQCLNAFDDLIPGGDADTVLVLVEDHLTGTGQAQSGPDLLGKDHPSVLGDFDGHSQRRRHRSVPVSSWVSVRGKNRHDEAVRLWQLPTRCGVSSHAIDSSMGWISGRASAPAGCPATASSQIIRPVGSGNTPRLSRAFTRGEVVGMLARRIPPKK